MKKLVLILFFVLLFKPVVFSANDNWVVTLLSVVAVLVILEDCVHPISESIQCEDWPK